ncbi:MAG TPA: NAD(P)H-dependent oxidoreductase [Dehalococcoidia bacterium]|nr:NAD(P)H-dependent oxidoreductase [Dehalococcoidia bacterium]
MPAPLAVAISGSPRAPSKSKTLAALLLASLARGGCETHMVDVADLPADALLARRADPALDDAIAAVGRATIVVAASPTYRALYTGAMKALFDLMPPAHLAGKICVPVQTGASPAHFLTLEYGMRPLFNSLEGLPIAGVYATDDQFADGQPDEKLAARVEQVADLALALARP